MNKLNDPWEDEEHHTERLLWTGALWCVLAVAAALAAAFDGRGATDSELIVPVVVSASPSGSGVSR
jgi:hypothetical protein